MRAIADFVGTWRIHRQIDDRRGGQAGQFQGKAVLAPRAQGGWLWAETGQMRIGAGPAMAAERRYIWQAQGARIAVFFEDGRYFHDFDPSGAQAEAHHDCPPDLYDVAYDFAAWPQWSSTWQVRGPRKDYRMESLHRRPGGR